MSTPRGLDIRLPIGGLFTILGLLLTGYGLLAPHAAAAMPVPGDRIDVNLVWGGVLLAFGAGMLWAARQRA